MDLTLGLLNPFETLENQFQYHPTQAGTSRLLGRGPNHPKADVSILLLYLIILNEV
jgi:hypothetical protein